MDRPCSTNGKKRNAYRMLVEKSEVNRLLGIPRRRWMDNIKMNLENRIGWYELD
jgi:hypothetical protein